MERWTTRAGVAVVMVFSLLLAPAGCKDDEGEPEGADGDGQQTAEGGDIGELQWDDDEKKAHTPLKADDLKPELTTVGPSQVVPRRVVVRFDEEVAGPGQVRPGEATEWSLEPPVAADVRFVDRNTLSFEPTEPLEPGAAYRLEVAKLEVQVPPRADGARNGEGDSQGENQQEPETITQVLEPKEPWRFSFETPKFRAIDVSPAVTLPGTSTANSSLRFSAAIDPAEVGRHITWTYKNSTVRARYQQGPNPYSVKVQLRHPGLMRPQEGSQIRIDIDDGVPSLSGAEGPGAGRMIPVQMADAVHIKNIALKEGSNGFYFEVICDDDAAGGSDYYWDRQARRSYRLSDRCNPDAASAEKYIEVSPEVDLRISEAAAGFRILGDFKRRSYTVHIGAGLETVDGGRVIDPLTRTFDVPARSPLVEIPASGRYITRKMWKNLGVRHRNVDSLNLKVRHVPRENLVFWLSGENDDADARTSNLVVDTEVPVDGPPDETTTDWLNVRKYVGEAQPGVYEINMEAEGKSDAARLLVTDINLVVKRSAPPPDAAWSRELLVWARGMESNEPLGGTNIKVVRKSGQVMARCTAGDDGGCRLKLPAKQVDPSPPFALIAEKGERITYLNFDELKTELLKGDTHGEPYRTDAPYRASVYGNRDVYRPGETAHLVGVIRDKNHRAPEAGMPVEMKMRDPRGRLVRDVVRETNAAGIVTLDETFPDMASTGKWRLQLVVGEKQVAEHAFNVEEFVPERMDVEAETDRDNYAFDERVAVNVAAEYLFGASAAGSEVEVGCRVEPTAFDPLKNADYNYGPLKLNEDFQPVTLDEVTGTIGEGGSTTLQCPPIPETSPFKTTGRLVANVAVLEAGSGRATRSTTSATVHPEEYYVGLRSDVDAVKAGETYKVQGIVVDWQGEPVTDVEEVDLEFVDLQGEWTRYYDSDGGRTRWKRHLRPAVESTQTVKIGKNGEFSIDMTPGSVDDGYLVRARAGSTRTELKFDRDYQYYWFRGPRETRDQTPRPQAPTAMHVDVPDPIQVGQKHTASFTAPYKGRVLLTIETDRVIQYEWKEVEAGKHDWSFTLDKFYPNVYVSAFLVKDPHLESEEAFLPDRAFGVDNGEVRPVEYTREVSLETPEEVQPNEQLTIRVDAGENDGNTWATVAAVDEGILSLTNYETPNPLDDIFARRGLGVDTFDTVGWALSLPPRGQSSATGGGSGDGRLGRVMPVEPVALWSGLRKVPEDGKLEVRLDVPQYRGELRVMAHVTSPEKLGMAETAVKVRDPLAIQTTTPRFLTAGDQVQVPVFVSNMTDRDRRVQVKLQAREKAVPGVAAAADTVEPLIELKNDPLRTLNIPAGESATAVYVVRANRHGGAAAFTVTAKSGSLESRSDSTVPFKASGPTERIVKRLEVSEGTTDLSQHLTGWVPTSENSTFWLTNIKRGRAFDHLKRLIRYPYGCIEQTSSSTRPLLHVSELVHRNDPQMVAQGDSIDAMVEHGVNRLLSMQTPSGGFAYWPGGSNPHPWGSAYAADILLQAREQGYEVPKERLDRAFDWMGNYAQNAGGSQNDRWLGTPGLAFMHFVLARADRGNKAAILSRIRQLPSSLDGSQRERAYLLKAALFLAGDRRYEEDLKDPYVDTDTGGRDTGGDFYSHRRRRGMILNVFVELFGPDPAGTALAERVGEDIDASKSSRWYSTQELVWGTTALGKWYREKAKNVGDATLRAGGSTIDPAVKGQMGPAWALTRASEYGSLELEVTDSKADQLYLVVSSEGVRQTPNVDWGANGLALSREYLNRDGEPVDWSTHSLGDVVYTRVSITNQTSKTVRNIALEDRLPAGWEVENPRLGGRTAPGWIDGGKSWQVDHMNIRDDRLAVFGDLEAGQTRQVTYATRATLAGNYQIPPVSAEAMYDPSVEGRERGRTISINGPWAKYID